MRPRATQRRLWIFAAAVLGLVGCATPPTEYREPPPLAAADRGALNLRVFDRVWTLVNRHYFDAAFRGVNWPAMRERYRPEAARAPDTVALYDVLNRLCAELKESHLVALSPRRVHEIETEHRPAIGIRWQLVDGQRIVSDVVPGGPADRAGIERGWLIVSRNGVPLREDDPFVTRLGEPIAFEFRDRKDRLHSFTMLPELLDFERLETRELPGGFVYLRFDRFGRGSIHWLSDELKRHPGAPGVIVDLRQNGGGNTFALNLAVAEFFPGRVDEGRLIRRSGWSHEEHSFGWLPARYAGRVVLLAGGGTGSAAEIFTHVLQHYRRATVIGRKTAGAVIYSQTYPLPDQGRLQVPVVDYVGLDGQRLEGHGVIPDVLVAKPSLAQLRSAFDPDLAKALEEIRAERPLVR